MASRGRTDKIYFHIDIRKLQASPSMKHLKALAATMRELRPQLLRHLQGTTICVHSAFQKALLKLVFALQPPATPITVNQVK